MLQRTRCKFLSFNVNNAMNQICLHHYLIPSFSPVNAGFWKACDVSDDAGFLWRNDDVFTDDDADGTSLLTIYKFFFRDEELCDDDAFFSKRSSFLARFLLLLSATEAELLLMYDLFSLSSWCLFWCESSFLLGGNKRRL